MRKVLVLGGTRFFGKRLVDKLIENQDEVTVATRGETGHSFGDRVKHVKVNRFDRKSMEESFQGGEWDIIYDQICFAPDDAKDACDIFDGKVKRYVLTSTLSVYTMDNKAEKTEKDFNPYTYEIKTGRKESFEYGEGKRLAEAVFFQKASFPVVAPRPPIVFGIDDYTERLHYHVRKIIYGEKIKLNHPEAKVSFVDSDDLANFLFWVGFEKFTGPVNASASDQISLGSMLELMEKKIGKSAKIEDSTGEKETSPMNFPVSIYQDVSLAIANGYTFKPLNEWFEVLVGKIVDQEM